jgi:hypothetical protein
MSALLTYFLDACCLSVDAGEWSRIAPLRILSIDIECAGRKGHFPEASLDPVIQIASMVTVLGEAKPRVKNIMTLGSCAAIVGAEVGLHHNALGCFWCLTRLRQDRSLCWRACIWPPHWCIYTCHAHAATCACTCCCCEAVSTAATHAINCDHH